MPVSAKAPVFWAFIVCPLIIANWGKASSTALNTFLISPFGNVSISSIKNCALLFPNTFTYNACLNTFIPSGVNLPALNQFFACGCFPIIASSSEIISALPSAFNVSSIPFPVGINLSNIFSFQASTTKLANSKSSNASISDTFPSVT